MNNVCHIKINVIGYAVAIQSEKGPLFVLSVQQSIIKVELLENQGQVLQQRQRAS